MTGKVYVAIRCLKACVLSIVRGSFSLSFIKGIRRNLRKKISGSSEHFHSKGQVPLKNDGFTLSNVPYPLKLVSSVRRQAVFSRT